MARPLAVMISALMLGAAFSANAGPLKERLLERMQQRAASAPEGGTDEDGELADMGGTARSDAMSCADWSQRVNRLQQRLAGRHSGPTPDLKDVAYGPRPLQTLDIYRAQGGGGRAPVVLMVHGGGWCVGDKAAGGVVQNKVERWTPRGLIVVSANYPMVSDGDNALAQAHHIARALAFVQAHAVEWGGDGSRVVLMGHSAGAHLVSLVNASSAIRAAEGARPALGTVSLDAGAVDVVTQMPQVYPFLKTRYREAFGTTEAEWIPASPFHQLTAGASPWLGVCSTQRKDDPCAQARAYVDKSRSLGIPADVLPQPKNHGAINKTLGEPGAYTDAVERFMAGLDGQLAGLLRAPR
ncbi:alpha/beta hydrolase [Roseateles cellulosilyticus]|uniref:Alpha/beta hydrolase n=1 Tax=Pelomonas cellulosilytica TaxID=2906762 RepID=A0ABS8XV12_9BURK|nr:alpha/beta hydrolase [Pelomonas sp. P8]MCE4554466.1 alpha/beta hydrolase [Pelomonas sp. P8]